MSQGTNVFSVLLYLFSLCTKNIIVECKLSCRTLPIDPSVALDSAAAMNHHMTETKQVSHHRS